MTTGAHSELHFVDFFWLVARSELVLRLGNIRLVFGVREQSILLLPMRVTTDDRLEVFGADPLGGVSFTLDTLEQLFGVQRFKWYFLALVDLCCNSLKLRLGVDLWHLYARLVEGPEIVSKLGSSSSTRVRIRLLLRRLSELILALVILGD